jgi:superfamily II DNA/RNA helicase
MTDDTRKQRSRKHLARKREKQRGRIAASPDRVRAFRSIARVLFKNEVARERAYVERPYQVRAAIQAVTIALEKQNVGMELPTGTGKTLIACLAAVMWKQQRAKSRVLLVVPSRTLVVQHFEVSLWVAQSVRVDRLTDGQYGDPGALSSTLQRSDFLISTPGVLAGALRRGVVNDDVISSLDFVIVDEFDQFVVVDEEDRASVARYAEHWQELVRQLPQNTRYFVKSATLGIGEKTNARRFMTKVKERARFIGELLSPVGISVPERDYATVVPFNSIRKFKVFDSNVSSLVSAVHISKGIAHQKLDELVGAVDYKDVERRAPALSEATLGRSVQLRMTKGNMWSFRMTTAIREQFRGIVKLMMMPQFILEDLTAGLDVRSGSCVIKTKQNETVFLENVSILHDKRPGPDKHFRFLRGGKTDTLIDIVLKRGSVGERGVVFLRTITLLEGLKPLLVETGLPLFELTGEKSDDERRVAIARFRRTRNGLLLMTRTTGGRGLDLPFAHYAIFYSPKTSPVTMWQEMSRIRSTVSQQKDTYVLCYGDSEAGVLDEVVEELQSQGRRASIHAVGIG